MGPERGTVHRTIPPQRAREFLRRCRSAVPSTKDGKPNAGAVVRTCARAERLLVASGEWRMSWTAAIPERRGEGVSCCVCGRRAPRDPLLVWSAGWQVRNDYPMRYRCPRCRRRQEPEAAA